MLPTSRSFGLRVTALCLFTLLPALAAAQSNSNITGVVRDTSGAVLPGVTVEAASPALIERARTVVTDTQGRYSIINLQVGVYTVTFTLPGFATAKRDGVELTANFTATVNADLQVGSLEETVTVSGDSPIVDVQSTASRNLIRRDVLDAVPTGRTVPAYIALTPGMTVPATGQDVGGSKGETFFAGSIHGSKEMLTVLDGFVTNTGASGRVFVPNPGSTQEVSVELGGGAAEFEVGGIQLNFVGKDGGNRFSGDLFTNFTNDTLQGSNASGTVLNRGLNASSINKIRDLYEVTGTLGGPIKHDRVWFLASLRAWGGAGQIAGIYYNKTPQAYVYTPDSAEPAISDYVNRHATTRVTWQVTPKNRINVSYDYQYRCDCHKGIDGNSSSPIPLGGSYTPEAVHHRIYRPNDVIQANWAFPASNKLLFEAATSAQIYTFTSNLQSDVTADTIAVYDQTLNLYYRAPWGYGISKTSNSYSRASMSYVTGSHVFKTGVQMGQEWNQNSVQYNGNLTYTLRGGRPVQLTQWATPYNTRQNLKANLGLYAQDRWTISRLTITAGLRMDYLNAFVPPQEVAANKFASARSYARVDCIPCWTDLSPRLSVAYDLFGNGKTALKASINRYVQYSTGLTGANPLTASVNSATRAWNDVNGDFVPDCDLANPAPNGECQRLSNSNFGTNAISTRYAEDVRMGFNVRPANWQGSAGIQHQLAGGVALNASYFRTSWRNFTVTDNLTVTPRDYDAYCITVPSDARLPAGGGNRLCGLYDLNPSKFGLAADNLVARASEYGAQTDIYNGVDLTVAARLPRGAFLSGGLSAGRTETDTCFVVDSPQVLHFCNTKPPVQPQIKFTGAYPLPWSLQASGTFQDLPGIPVAASYVATNDEVARVLGRSLSGNASTVTIPNIIKPQTMFEGRIYQLDLRLARTFRVGRTRVEPMFDAYNVLNASPILTEQTRYGPVWLTPQSILEARLFKFGVKLNF